MQSAKKQLDIRDRQSGQFWGAKAQSAEGGPGREEEEEGYIPISLLHPYKTDWSIKARVTRKGELKEWKNSRGQGLVFSLDLMDRLCTEITATFYNEAASKYFQILEQDQVYTFADGKVSLNRNKQYNKGNDHVLVFDHKCQIVKETGPSEIKSVALNPTSLGSVARIVDPQAPCFDVLGVVVDEGSIQSVALKAGGNKDLRTVLLLDQDKVGVELSMWGGCASDPSLYKKNTVLAVKDCRASIYQNAVRIQPSHNSVFVSNVASLPQARALYEWYQSADLKEIETFGVQGEKHYNSLYRTLAQLEQETALLQGDRKIYSDLYVYLGLMRKDAPPYYLGCPSCSRKVTEEGSQFLCHSCGEACEVPKCKFIFSAQFWDQSGKAWLQLNNNVGEQVLATTADALFARRDDPECLAQCLEQAKYSRLKLRVVSALDTYNQETRVRHGVIRVFSPDPVQEHAWIHNYLLSSYP